MGDEETRDAARSPTQPEEGDKTVRQSQQSSVKESSIRELVNLGKELGLTGVDLREFMKEQQDHEREERRLRREALKEERGRPSASRKRSRASRKRSRPSASRKRCPPSASRKRCCSSRTRITFRAREGVGEIRLNARLESHNDEKVSFLEQSAVGFKQSLTLKVPKFENKQLSNVAKYLSVFEGVMTQNAWDTER